MERRGMLRLGLMSGLAVLAARPALAGTFVCAGKAVALDTVTCPDGTIPSYTYFDLPAAPGEDHDRTVYGTTLHGHNQDATSRVFTGIWHTEAEGVSYARTADVPGAYRMDGPIGLRGGDLSISINGAWVWNTVRGSAGRWIPANPDTQREWQFILIDEQREERWLGTVVEGMLHLKAGGRSVSGLR